MNVDFQEDVGMDMTLKEAQEMFKKKFVKGILAYTHGNRRKAAEIMGIQRTYLSRLINELDLQL